MRALSVTNRVSTLTVGTISLMRGAAGGGGRSGRYVANSPYQQTPFPPLRSVWFCHVLFCRGHAVLRRRCMRDAGQLQRPALTPSCSRTRCHSPHSPAQPQPITRASHLSPPLLFSSPLLSSSSPLLSSSSTPPFSPLLPPSSPPPPTASHVQQGLHPPLLVSHERQHPPPRPSH